MAKHVVWTEQARAGLRYRAAHRLAILKTLARYAETGEATPNSFEMSSHPCSGSALRISACFSATGDHLEISRVLDRKEAYR